MLRAECTLISCLALLAPQFLTFLPLRAFFDYGLWIALVQLAGLLVLVQPIVFCELALGQRSQFGPLKCWCFGPAWKGIGFLMLITTALDLTTVNVDIMEYLRQYQINDFYRFLYFQLALWGCMVPLLAWWPKVTSKLWVVGSLVCLGGIVALSARSLTLAQAESSLQRLWRLSARVPENLLDLLRVSLLPCLSASGTGVLIVLGSYRSRHTNALLDSGLMTAIVFCAHGLFTLGTASLAAHYCTIGDANGSVQCRLEMDDCPMVALSRLRNSTCDLLVHYDADTADKTLGGVKFYTRMLESLPRNQVSPALWLWTWRSVLGWVHLTYLLVRADTWVRAIADKLQGARPLRRRVWTARWMASLLTCSIMGSLAMLMQHYKDVFSVQDVYRLSTVRWLPLLLAALTCLAVTHGYGGVRFIKEVGGGVALRPWFFVLVGFVTPALAIGLAGLRMHVSIQKLLWPPGGHPSYNRLIDTIFDIPNYVNLLLAVSAFLFLLAGLFSPLIWHGLCRRQRCIDLVQPTKSWQRARHSSEDSNINGGDVIRDLGTTTMEETPMLQGPRQHQQHHQHQQQQQQQGPSGHPVNLSNPVLSELEPPLPPPPPPEPKPVMYMNAKPMQPVKPLEVAPPPPPPALMLQQQQQQQQLDGYGTVRFQNPDPAGPFEFTRPPTSQPYSTATLPARDKQKGEIRFNLNDANPTATKTLNRGILKNKHQGDSFRQQYQEECIPLRSTDNPYNARAEMYKGGQGEIL